MRRHDHKKGRRTMPTIDRAFRPASYPDELDPRDRAAHGAVHPSRIGGEYLPNCLPGEVEIARIVLASVTQDVVGIRARRRGQDRRIQYRVLDEYGSEFQFSPRSSRRPITQEELVRLIDTLQDADAAAEGRSFIANVLHYNAGSPLERLAGFVTVESLFHSGLGAHFRDVTLRLAREAE
jgi:hypothetical protein